jgi:putative addiction module CopG family antidote
MHISLPPDLRRFVDQQIASGRYKKASDVVRVALQRMDTANRLAKSPVESLLTSSLYGSDIESLVFLVMMEATQDADEDLKAIMAEVKAMTAAKSRLRDLISKVRRDVATNSGCNHDNRKLDFSRGLGSEQAYHRAPMPVADPEAAGGVRLEPCDLYRGTIGGIAELQAILNDLKDRLDSMNEPSEMTSLRLQMMMDRRSKFISTLSNIMKKISATQDTITQNLK